ncbi:MAG: trypsin [Ignavibacteriae bacterium HGW-Ignavibacteriae-3]|nr:MAG: trypsin [Ignavibacteriae bacterium HGW-Ignavibacteriae-3]
MRKKNIIGTASLVFIGIVFGAILVSGFGWVRPSYGDVKIGANKPPVEQLNADAAAFNNAFVQVAEKVTPSIVQITVLSSVKKDERNNPYHFFFKMPFGNEMPQEREGGGSGIIISEDGFILTNNHVIENAKQVTVTLHDKRVLEATVIGTDPLTDLGVIKIDAQGLPAAYLGNSEELKVGQWVMAIGNPLSLSSTVTAGIISAKSRKININNDQYAVEDFIQTDAAINPGNSGGALVDLNGAVIGVNSAIATNGMTQSYIGYGFAIPVNLAKSVANDLIANGKISRGYIGVSIEEVNAATAKAMGLDEPRGVIIQAIVEGGSAAQADIKKGDIILKIDEKEINQPNELQSYVASKRAGTVVKLALFRDGKSIERNITLKARDNDDTKTIVASDKMKKGKDLDAKEISLDKVGMTVRNMSDDEKEQYNVKSGVMVSDVKNYGKAFQQRLFTGAVIVSADRKDINTVSELQAILESKKGKAVLLNVVDNQGNSRLVGLEIPQ